jgi:hypothetical protein
MAAEASGDVQGHVDFEPPFQGFHFVVEIQGKLIGTFRNVRDPR